MMDKESRKEMAGLLVAREANGHLGYKGTVPETDALQSWKEIAAYLRRGIRTAQRWERSAGLPVHRPRPGDRSQVFAFPTELDEWLHSLPTRNFSSLLQSGKD